MAELDYLGGAENGGRGQQLMCPRDSQIAFVKQSLIAHWAEFAARRTHHDDPGPGVGSAGECSTARQCLIVRVCEHREERVAGQRPDWGR